VTGKISWAGVLAAGDGSRLVRDGYRAAKPLVLVAGVPLVEHAIENVLGADVERVIVLFNEREQDCADFVHRRFPGGKVEVILKTTSSSLESFREVSARLPAGRTLFSTVDAWCPREDFARFARAAAERDLRETVLAVTPFVDDELPLWVRADSNGRVTAIGADTGEVATAGAYVFSPGAREASRNGSHPRLRNFLAWLVENREPVSAIAIEKVIDVDRGSDVAAAEALAASSRAAAAGSPR
jgi:NDP-sugar pyrophosphorylase family protein